MSENNTNKQNSQTNVTNNVKIPTLERPKVKIITESFDPMSVFRKNK